jgi:hypothetical protein
MNFLLLPCYAAFIERVSQHETFLRIDGMP